ncbi:MAG: methyltransferase, partial [Acidobacteria bacterium]
MSTPKPVEQPAQVAMLQLISGFWISRGVFVVAKLGIPDLLASGAKTAEELAQLTDVHAPSLFRIL